VKPVALAFALLAQGAFALLPPIPKVVTSSDGFIKVVAADVPGDELGFRTPILSFASHVVRNLSGAYSLELPRRREPGLIIHADVGTSNDVRVIVRRTRRDGQPLTRIHLPCPGYSDIEKLRVEVGKAFFRSWFTTAGTGGEEMADDLPDWLVQGAFRAADPQTALADRLFVLELWRSGKLPFFPALCTDLRVANGPAASLAGYVADWMNEKRLFAKWLERLAKGNRWDGARLAAELTGEGNPAMQDRANDERLVKMARSVLSPGRANGTDVGTFASRLMLYPPAFDRTAEFGGPFCTFREAAMERGTNELVKAAAAQKAMRVPLFAIGRGDEMQQAASDYAEFLRAVAKGEPGEIREGLLDKADAAFLKAREKVYGKKEAMQ